MYTATLTLHSYLRWLVLAAALIALVRAATGIARRRPWAPADETAARLYGISLDVQVLIGLVLYAALSPFTPVAWSDLGATMRDAPLRSLMIEHPVGMIVALALAHIGRARIRRTPDLVRRHRTAAIFFGLSLVVILGSIPWPGTPGARPVFRGITDTAP